ncbi:MAG: ABC transporter ATPase [Bacteroidia bacterium]
MTTLSNMPQEARLWVYQSSKPLSDAEVQSIQEAGNQFISGWAAHGAGLKASFDILHNLFIVIAVDEAQALASGCSIDKSVHFIKSIEQQMHLDLFDRMQVAYRKGAEIKVCRYSEFEKLAAAGEVDASTIVFNNMVTSKKAFDKEWEVPLKQSWQSRVLA